MANSPVQRVIVLGTDPSSSDGYSEQSSAQLQGAAGANNIATGQVTLPVVSGGNRLIAATRTGRTSILVMNDTGNTIYVGNSGVTAGNGLKVPASQSVTIEGSAAVYAINSSSTATQLVTYMEAYNA